jgi:IstB-like ATP binding protein
VRAALASEGPPKYVRKAAGSAVDAFEGAIRATFGRWGEVFGDDVVAAAMIDRLLHHAEVIALKGDSYRIKDRDLGRVPGSTTEE